MTTTNESSKPADGGPAFPTLADNGHSANQDGLSLRDYFAAKAMQGVFTVSPIPSTAEEQAYIAMHAYRLADSMLKARG
ncbi:MAG: hypothetical protein V4801_02535 [Burkholderia gladioli]